MRYGLWLPLFGGWLLNVEDEGMPPTFNYSKEVAQAAENWGYDTTLLAELYLNGFKGTNAEALEAWSTAAALAAVTEKIEIMSAVRPVFHKPAVTAKMAANIDHISNGRFTLNIVPGWSAEEAKQYGAEFTGHDERYDRTEEFLDILKGLWEEETFSYNGKFHQIENTQLAPKPVQKPNPVLYAGGESERGKQVITSLCDAYILHGHTVKQAREKIADMKERRAKAGQEPFQSFGMAAYVICRDTEEEAQAELERITTFKDTSGRAAFKDFKSKSKLEQKIQLQNYSVSNRGLRPNLVGTPEQIATRILEFEKAGVDLLLLQCSPQLEELKRFSKEVMPKVEELRS